MRGFENKTDSEIVLNAYDSIQKSQAFFLFQEDQFKSSGDMGGLIKTAAACDEPVLLLGESGSGKSFYAEKIHRMSSRSNYEMQKYNAASFAPAIIESQLFGTEPGAFTDSVKTKGIFEQADKSTLFLDEISELPLELQAKLLCVLEDKRVRRLGSSWSHNFDARFIFASNKDLKSLVSRGLFREDLYYRISVIQIKLPPLRQRMNDLDCIAREVAGEKGKLLDDSALGKLKTYDWPGNIRELKNVVSKACIFSSGKLVTDKDIVFE